MFIWENTEEKIAGKILKKNASEDTMPIMAHVSQVSIRLFF